MSPETRRAGSMLHRAVLGAALSAATAGLVLAVVMVSSDRAPVSLYQASPSLSGKPSPSQQVAAAQAKVARDLAALRRTEAQVGGRQTQKLSHFGPFAKYGPRAGEAERDFEFPEGRDGGEEGYEFSRTPRVASRAGDPEFRYGPNARYCPGGNCEHLDESDPNFASERWPVDVYRGLPYMSLDPDASPARNRAINEREGEFADELHPDAYHPPVHWGVGGLEGSGTMAAADRGAVNLDAAGVAHDRLPWDMYRSLPWPGFDRTQYDRDAHEDRYPLMDPLEQAQETQDSKQALVDAGVDVDRSPTDTHDRTYNQVDGLNDKLVPVESAPKWRKGGTAAQEEPPEFLLREHPDMSGPQPVQDRELGYEIQPEKPYPEEQAHWGFWESIGCGTNGCFGARNAPEGDGA